MIGLRNNINLLYLWMHIFTMISTTIGQFVHVKCGTGHRNMDDDSDDAHNAKRGNWPWMVKLTNHRRYLCGASIIDREFILTSARCVEYLHGDISGVAAVIGAHTLMDSDDYVTTIKVKKILNHPFYSNETKKNDIAILQLVEPVDFNTNKTIRPICVSMHRLTHGEDVFVTGWGTTRPFEKADHLTPHPDHPLSDTLKQAKVTIVQDKDYCQYNKSLGYYTSGFCTSFAESGHHNCIGDSGSPVMYLEQRGSPWRQQGVVSWSEEDCGGHRHPAVNTDVSDYASWIAQVIFFLTGRDMDQFAAPTFK